MEELTKNEELLLRSWDATVQASERNALAALLQQDHVLRKQSDHYLKVRELLKHQEPDTFGPFFAERVMNMIRKNAENLEGLVFFFFKKYQLVVLGVVVALVLANLFITDQLTLASLFGLDKDNAQGVFTIDLYEDLTH